MKTTAFAIALLMSGAAFAYGPGTHAGHDATQPSPTAEKVVDGSAAVSSDPALDAPANAPANAPADVPASAPTNAPTDQSAAYQTTSTPAPTPASGATVQASNENPERDARGIKVISAEAMVPSGFNGVTGAGATGGPELDPATGEPASDKYPACSAKVTDNCLQAYERGRARS